MKNQTAVEWLVNEANKRKCWADEVKMNWLISEANEIFEQQIVDARMDGIYYGSCNNDYDDNIEHCEKYFTETYGE